MSHVLVRSRWWALAGCAGVAVLAGLLLDIALPTGPIVMLITLGVLWNASLQATLSTHHPKNDETGGIVRQLVLDTLLISLLLFFSGGSTNPLVFMLLLPVAAAALVLDTWPAVGIALLGISAYSLLMAFHVPLELVDPSAATRWHLAGMAATFVAASLILTALILHVRRLLQRREADLQQAREQVLRDRQLLAIGTLAASAAHELGTPLATMRLLADELAANHRRLAVDPGASGQIEEDLTLLSDQLGYCKRIVTGLTERAGVGRSDAVTALPADFWIRQVVADWRQSRGVSDAPAIDGTIAGPAPAIAVDAGLAQSLCSLLDNSRRVDPRPRIQAAWTAYEVSISVLDRGPGFPAPVLDCQGQTAQSPHADGEGLGLMLARRQLERFGGRLVLVNRRGGGSSATLRLPILGKDPVPRTAAAHGGGAT